MKITFLVAAAGIIALSAASSMAQTPKVQAMPAQAPAVRAPGVTVQVPAPVIPPLDELKLKALDKSLRSLGSDVDWMALDFDLLGRDFDLQEMEARAKAFAQARPTPTPRIETPFYIDVARDGLYDAGLSMIDDDQYQRAIDMFDRVIKAGKSRVDGALYWKAYAQDRLGQRTEALATLQELQKSYPASRWLSDAKALEIEVRQNAGQSVKPEDHGDEDLKVLAINSLMQSDPERGIPMLQQVLKGRNSLKVKERALFVLAQSKAPQAREVLIQVARGASNPDLQMKAIRYLGAYSRSDTQALGDIYQSSSDPDVKREILRSLVSASDVDRLIQIAKSEQSTELRSEAIRYLGSLARTRQVMTQFQARSLADAKGRAFTLPPAFGGDSKPKVDPAVVANALVQMYKTEKDPAVKKQIIGSLAVQDNAAALVSLARAETDLTMKREIVARLATMKSKEATDYMLEILK